MFQMESNMLWLLVVDYTTCLQKDKKKHNKKVGNKSQNNKIKVKIIRY